MRQLSDPDLMAVITMHQLMLLLIDGAAGVGRACAVQAAFQVGQAIEREAFLQKKMESAVEKEHEEFESWGEEICVKVGSRLIGLLIKTATVQPPVDELGNAPPTRPAFKHYTKKLIIDDKEMKPLIESWARKKRVIERGREIKG